MLLRKKINLLAKKEKLEEKMPRGDRTGPHGLGPGTGRKLGFCFGYETPGFTKGYYLGFGRGFRGGRRINYGRYWQSPNPHFEPPLVSVPVYKSIGNIDPNSSEGRLEMLKQEKEYMESELKAIQNALEDISKKILELEQQD